MHLAMGTTLISLLVSAPTPTFPQENPPDDSRGGGMVLQGVNFQDLTLVVERITEKTILWPKGVNPSAKPIYCVTEQPSIDTPERLFKLYLCILHAWELCLVPIGDEEAAIYKVFAVRAGSKGIPDMTYEPLTNEDIEDSWRSLEKVSPRFRDM